MTWENKARLGSANVATSGSGGTVSSSGTVNNIRDNPFFEADLNTSKASQYYYRRYLSLSSDGTATASQNITVTCSFPLSRVSKIGVRWTTQIASGAETIICRLNSVQLYNNDTLVATPIGTTNRNSNTLFSQFATLSSPVQATSMRLNLQTRADALRYDKNGINIPADLRHWVSFMVVYTELFELVFNVRENGSTYKVCGILPADSATPNNGFFCRSAGTTYKLATTTATAGKDLLNNVKVANSIRCRSEGITQSLVLRS